MRERNIIINIRVTDKEKKALERSAKCAGLSLSAFLRKAGLNEKIFVKPSASLFKAYEAMERLLKMFPSFSKGDIEVCLIDIEEKLLDAYHEAGEKLERSLQELSDRGGETATKANETLDRVRALLDRVEVSKNEALAIVTKFDESEGSARMFLDKSSKFHKDFDLLQKDFDALLSGVKKDGLKLNVDIF